MVFQKNITKILFPELGTMHHLMRWMYRYAPNKRSLKILVSCWQTGDKLTKSSFLILSSGNLFSNYLSQNTTCSHFLQQHLLKYWKSVTDINWYFYTSFHWFPRKTLKSINTSCLCKKNLLLTNGPWGYCLRPITALNAVNLGTWIVNKRKHKSIGKRLVIDQNYYFLSYSLDAYKN